MKNQKILFEVKTNLPDVGVIYIAATSYSKCVKVLISTDALPREIPVKNIDIRAMTEKLVVEGA